MPKKRKPGKAALSKYPPSGFWLSPQGAVLPVQIHAELLTQIPEVFGLEKAPHGKEEIEQAMADVVNRGWIRARVFEKGTLNFQAWKADRETIHAITEFLYGNHAGITDIIIETVEPRGYVPFTLQEFFDRAYPVRWGLGSEES